jgi:copper(I)-binding protein
MKRQMHKVLATVSTTALQVALAAALLLPGAQAHEYYAKSFTVTHPWAMPTELDATSAPVYMRIDDIVDNDRLLSANTNIAERVELRAGAVMDAGTGADNGLLTAIDLPATGSISLLPETTHLVLVNLAAPLQWQRSYPLTLVFEKAGIIEVMISIGEH